MKKISLIVALLLTLSIAPPISHSFAASNSPAPKITPKVSASPKASATKVPAKKKIVKKPVKKKPVKKKKIRVSPSPSAVWPPKGFKVDGDEINKVYAKVPTSKELVGLISAKPSLALLVKDCKEFTCGAVQIASDLACTWWEISGFVIGATSPDDRTIKRFGTVRTTSGKSMPRELRTILLITTEPLGDGHIVDQISVVCHQDPPAEQIPSTLFTPEIVG
jgi:hypothetical protein